MPRTVLDTYDESKPCYVIGIMSGTSLDGVDMCLCEIIGSSSRVLLSSPSNTATPLATGMTIKVIHFGTAPFPTSGPFGDVKSKLKRAMTIEGSSVDLICDVNFSFSRFVGTGVLDFLREVDTLGLLPFNAFDNRLERVVLGSHGQTVWHTTTGGSTLQIGDTEVLAHVTGMVCVGNFRAADVAVGGQGAPLVPYFDSVVARLHYSGDDDKTSDSVCFQNLGGIGNVTYVSPSSKCIAFDTGPANVATNELLDQLAALYQQGQSSSSLLPLSAFVLTTLGLPEGSSLYDRDAVFSSQGSIIKELLDGWLEDAYILEFRNRPPPKSTGRELFGARFVRDHVIPKIVQLTTGMDTPAMIQCFNDVCRTLIYMSAFLVAESYQRFLPSIPETVVVSGGGRRHPLLLQDIHAHLTAARAKQLSITGITTNHDDTTTPPPPTTIYDEDDDRKKGKGREDVHILSLGDMLTSIPKHIDADDAKEAIAFALFAHEKMLSLVHRDRVYFTNLPDATGASRKVCLGQVSIPL